MLQGSLFVSGPATLSNATTTSLAITGITSALLKTNANGSVIPAIAGTDYVSSVTGDWTGTFDGRDGSFYLANSFSTSSADYYITQTNLTGFSTSSADYWKDQRNFFSTSSANYFSSLGLAFSTSSANYWAHNRITSQHHRRSSSRQ